MVLVIYPTLIDKGRGLKKVLGYPVFYPLGRLAYGAYIFHPFYYINNCWFAIGGYYFTQSFYIRNPIETIIVSYIMSFLMTLLLESPVNSLIRDFLEGPRIAPKPLEEKAENTIKQKKLKES